MNEVAAMDCNLRDINDIGLYTTPEASVLGAALYMARIDHAESQVRIECQPNEVRM